MGVLVVACHMRPSEAVARRLSNVWHGQDAERSLVGDEVPWGLCHQIINEWSAGLCSRYNSFLLHSYSPSGFSVSFSRSYSPFARL